MSTYGVDDFKNLIAIGNIIGSLWPTKYIFYTEPIEISVGDGLDNDIHPQSYVLVEISNDISGGLDIGFRNNTDHKLRYMMLSTSGIQLSFLINPGGYNQIGGLMSPGKSAVFIIYKTSLLH